MSDKETSNVRVADETELAERVRVGDVAETSVADPAASEVKDTPAYLLSERPEDAPGTDPESTHAILDRWVLAGGLDSVKSKTFSVPYTADGRHALLDAESGEPANKTVSKYFSDLEKCK